MVGEVVVLGMQDHLQVWNRELFERRLAAEPITDEDLDALSGI
jgi:DNA-binding transcriptional regulator/RsmH inhibitor MraZ